MARVPARYNRLEPMDLDPERLQQHTVAVVGLGATGSHMAATLARYGLDLVMIDRDFLEPANLSTSALYTVEHVENRLPKAVAAAQRLAAVNPDTAVEHHVVDVNADTIHQLLEDAGLVMDGTDNMATRSLLNEYAVKTGTPWIHVAALGHSGEMLPVIPEETACFECIFDDVDGTALDTCETAGILKDTAATAASIATTQAVHLLSGNGPARNGDGLTRFNLQQPRMQTLNVQKRADCKVCGDHKFPYLCGERGTSTTRLCGENTYQVNPNRDGTEDLDLQQLAASLAENGTVTQNQHLLRFESKDVTFTVFNDGRAIVTAETPEAAKTVYATYIGN